MSILNHEHQITPVEGRLLYPEEIIARGLDISKRYYINGRCSLPGCDYITIGEILPGIIKLRSPRIYTGKKR